MFVFLETNVRSTATCRGVTKQEEREIQAREAWFRVEACKKAGVYAVLKKIEVWQIKHKRRLSDVFNGGGETKYLSGGGDVYSFVCPYLPFCSWV